MSYAIYLTDKNTKETIELNESHGIWGNMYCPSETRLYINLTFNYRSHFIEVFGEDGIHWLNDKVSKDTWPKLMEGIEHFTPATQEEERTLLAESDPWKPNKVDACIAFKKLLALALKAPYAVWQIEN